MAKNKKVKVEDFGSAVFDILDEYRKDIDGEMPSCVESVAQTTAQIARAKATAFKGNKYRNSITVKVTKGRLLSTALIYSPKHYQLTHLLEHGHVIKVNGKVYGKTRAFPHWAPAEEQGVRLLEYKIKKAVES